jgi:hypothetical protein
MQTKLKHTPGPWVVKDGWDENGNGKYFPSVIMGHISKLSGEMPQIVVNESHDQHRESIMANAKLIAAAPDMLDVIKELYEWAINNNVKGRIFPKLEAAYLKATK